MNVDERLREEFENQIQKLHTLEAETEGYKNTADLVTKLADRIIEINKIEMECENKERDREIDIDFKEQEIKNLKKDRIIHNVIEGAKVIVPVVGAFTMGLISMKWEKLDTLTSTAGKSSLRDILRFK